MKKIYTVVMLFVMLCGVFTVHSVERCEAVSRVILYVDGEFGNYSTIQDAINNATDGDTVFVYNGTYYENIVIDKTINLIGENKDNTTIDGNGIGNVVSISSDLVNISGFTIKNGSIGIYLETYTNDNSISGNCITDNSGYGISISSECEYNNISGNVIAENNNGIFLDDASWNIIVENIIINNDNTGILLWHSSNNNNISRNNIASNHNGIYTYGSKSFQCKNNIISANNIVENNQDGIWLSDWSHNNIISKNTISFNTRYGLWMDKSCNFNDISGNTVENNGRGIYILGSYGNIVIENSILESSEGIYLDGGSHENRIYHNNLINNVQNAFDSTSEDNYWDNGYPVGGNYWDDYNGNDADNDSIGDQPYDIPGGGNRDDYPLMEPVTQPPIADANGPYVRLAHLEIEFDGSNSYDPDGYIESYLWDFGDGTNATTVTAVHTYTVVGNYTVTLAVTDNRGRTSINSTYALIKEDIEPPSKVTGLTVSDAKDGKLSLSWNASIDNVAIDHYIVYRDSTLVINRTTTEYLDTGLKNDQIYIYQVSAVDLSRNEGEKSNPELGKSTASSSPPSHSGPSPERSNYNRPTADAGGPYYGWIGDEIEFDGTGSHDNDEDDSSIVQYDWKYFKEDIWHNDIGATPSHIYNETGEYTLTLRVHDDEGSTDTNSAMVIISKANSPPTNPIVDGETSGHQNIECSYTATSTDIDNDVIRYTFIWGDGNTTITEFYQNGTTIQQNHMWKAAGIYTISVQADDNETTSGLVLLTVLIDVAYVVDIGHVIDRDGNGIYDSFYSNATGNETIVEQLNNGNYLLDIDGDGNWDYVYNSNNGTLTLYEVADKTGITTEFSWILIIVVTIATVIVIVYSYRNGFFGKDRSRYTAKKSHEPLLKNKERKKFETEWKENEAYRKYGENK